MEWKLYKLNEICISISDGDHLAPPKSNNGIPFITISNVVGNSIDFCNTMFVPQEYYDRLDTKRKAQTDDILYTVVGSFGTPILIKDEKQFTFQRHIAILRPNKSVVPAFLYYTMKSSDFYSQADAYAIGSAQRTISLTSLRRMKVALPPLPTQQKIASILSTYDTLIENNTKRIRLLEQMAENLYKEWFVRFRFPGHENVEMENGLPKGWKNEKLFDVSDVMYGYAFKSDKFCADNNLNAVVRIRDIQDNHTDTYTDEVCDEKYLIKRNAILIGMDGIFHMCLWNGERAYLNQRVVMLNSKLSDVCNYLLYFAIRPQIKYWEQVIAGTTVAHLGDKHLKRVKVLMPDPDTLVKVNKIVENAMNEINNLQNQNKYLTCQRDLLLPRLMSGKLEVKV